MDKCEFRAILKRLNWTYGEAASRLDISPSSIANYAGGTKIPFSIAKLLRLWVPTEESTFGLSIRTFNDAFAEGGNAEVARILRELANRVEHYGQTEGSLYDVNGNRVGEFWWLA